MNFTRHLIDPKNWIYDDAQLRDVYTLQSPGRVLHVWFCEVERRRVPNLETGEVFIQVLRKYPPDADANVSAMHDEDSDWIMLLATSGRRPEIEVTVCYTPEEAAPEVSESPDEPETSEVEEGVEAKVTPAPKRKSARKKAARKATTKKSEEQAETSEASE